LSLAVSLAGCKKSAESSDEFTRLTNLGKSQLEQGDASKAIGHFQQALQLNPTVPEAQLNLANAFLRANRPADAIQQSGRVLQVDPNSAAALYIQGCAYLRLGDATSALKALQQSQKIDAAVTALNFQLALAHGRLGQIPEAVQQLQTAVEFEPEHPAAHYRLSQLLLRLGRNEEAAAELKAHQDLLAKKPNQPNDIAAFERCKHTLAKLPFKLEQPLTEGVKVAFTDATKTALGNGALWHGPLAVIDLAHDGRNSLFVSEGEGFRLLLNSNGVFVPQGDVLPGNPGARYYQSLAGDLQNDHTEDVVVLGDKGSHVFKFTTNGVVTETTRAAGFKDLQAVDGALLDFDYTGKLGLLALQPDGKGVRAFRNLGSVFTMYFSENSVTSGLPATVAGGRQLVLEDWNGDELIDVTIGRDGAAPLVFARERGGPFVAANLAVPFPVTTLITSGDLDADSLPDLVAVAGDKIEIVFGGSMRRPSLPLGGFKATRLLLVDYDNDGWLDLCAAGDGVRIWRNVGPAGFRETTQALGLDKAVRGKVQFVAAADFDGDCDIDLALAVEGAGLVLLRNDGGNANYLLKLQMVGHRSNSSGLGVRYEVTAGGLRFSRIVRQLPVEAGVGKHAQVDSVAVRWFDGFVNNDEIKVDQCKVIALEEIERPTGSCPYLYAWDGRRFRFVTDLLGASPLGLRITDTRFIDADSEEYVWIGSDEMFPPLNGNYALRVTEELREVLYLDEAKLVVVDHPPETEVHTTGKLVPGKPFPPHEIVTLHRRKPLLKAVNHEGTDVTSLLADADQKMVSPTTLRAPQLRGLAEPHSVTLDFGPLAVERPLVLALTGWLRFGGGMANVSGSHEASLPFPFPTLAVETAGGEWKTVDVVVGAPAGKTKTILVDLRGKLPPGSRRLRLSAAFEIHWDRVALFEKRESAETRVTTVAATKSDLHWRGYSEFEPLPWFLPLTPDYATAKPTADWTITPSGWCTRYGSVDELIAGRDNALALLNGGDELTLEFAQAAVPLKPSNSRRDFFFYSSGWDKDADFHCELGWQVEPLPWQGMDDQLYGRQARPPLGNDGWMKKYNTRWVGPHTLTKRRQ
jgi:Flp pilus assembly protein TadD